MTYCRLYLQLVCAAIFLEFVLYTEVFATGSLPQNQLPESGRGLYRVACAACHGTDGRGANPGMIGFDISLPDFTDCNFSTREADADWSCVAAEGGPARGFSEIMPAFGDALSDEQTGKIITHIRTFSECDDWPKGELNLPRALFTTKAFPEDELVFHSDIKTEGLDKISNKFIYERRIGARNQVEIKVPYGWNTIESGGHKEWTSSVGDITLGAKHVLFHGSSSIFSAGGEVLLPTGDEDEGFGNGTTVFEPYLAAGQLLPDDYFVQFQGGFELPVDDDNVQNEAFWKMAFGRTFLLGQYESNWSPMVEILGSKNIDSGVNAQWDIVPQVQIPLNRRQHVRLGIGVRVPLNNTDTRETIYGIYLLWDMFDGGFFEGW